MTNPSSTITPCTKRFVTVYPESWFGHGKGKQHATSGEGRFQNGYGNIVHENGKNVYTADALCGAVGQISGNEFKKTEGDVITCSRCAKKVKDAS